MGISYWSADVCSSDLLDDEILHRAVEPQRHPTPVERHAQPADQRIAERQAPILARPEAERPVEQIAREAFGEVKLPALLPEQQHIGFVELPKSNTRRAGQEGGRTCKSWWTEER